MWFNKGSSACVRVKAYHTCIAYILFMTIFTFVYEFMLFAHTALIKSAYKSTNLHLYVYMSICTHKDTEIRVLQRTFAIVFIFARGILIFQRSFCLLSASNYLSRASFPSRRL